MEPIRYIRIIALPMGDAPEWVRRKWIGLELPVLDPVPVTTRTEGVLTGGATSWVERVGGIFRSNIAVTGYLAPVDACVAILAEHHPDAAAWWRTNTQHLLDREDWWLFDERACELIPLKAPGPAA